LSSMPMKTVDSDLLNGFASEAFRALFRLTHDAILLQQIDRTIIDANPAAEGLFGIPLEEMLKQKIDDLLHINNHDVLKKAFTQPETDSQITFQAKTKTKEKHGLPVEVTTNSLFLKDSWFFISVVRPHSTTSRAKKTLAKEKTELETQILERTKELTDAGEQLRRSDERYEILVQNSLQGIAILDGPPFRYTYVNDAGSACIGYSQEELRSMTSDDVEELVHWTDRSKILRLIGEILSGKRKAVRTTTRFNTKNNDVIWLDISMTGAKMKDRMSLIITFIDVTEQRQALGDLMDTQRDLGIYASLLRHDLRNDLQVITGNTEVMRLSVPDNDVVHQCAEANVAGVKRMLEILTIFGKPEKEQKRLIAPILESLSVEAAKSYVGMVCQLHIDPEVLMTRVAGGMMLPMVFRNLIRNSAKYAGDKPRVDIRVKKSDDFIDVRVSDNGPGISESVRSRLFEKGVSTSGGGLGLYLSKKVVEAYGGSIQLLDPANAQEGAVFLVKLAIVSSESFPENV
jgi:PAS domain S-box-containing protein